MSLLSLISEKLTIYLGSFVLILGIVGGILNLLVFLSLKTFRQNSCAFYLIIMSISNVGQLISGLLTRLIINLTGIDWSLESVFYCKFRWYFIHICALVSFTCICLATIDQYLSTCSKLSWLNYSHIKYSQYFCLISTLFWLIYEIPSLILYNHVSSPTNRPISCSVTNLIYQRYNTFVYLLVLTGILPIIITILFGSLAYRNIQQIPFRTIPIVRRELDKQLTVMVLIQVIFNFFDIVPFLIVTIYSHLTKGSNTPTVAQQIELITAISTCLYYSYFAVRKICFAFFQTRYFRIF